MFKVRFRYQPVIAVRSVALAGTFNGWRRDQDIMKERPGSGVYELSLELPAGRHEYKFVVNGKTWLQDPGNPDSAPDGNEGHNSLVYVGRQPAKLEGKEGDGLIAGGELVHDPADLSFASSVDQGRRLILRLHTLHHDAEGVAAELEPAPAGGRQRIPLRRIGMVDGRDVYELRLHYPAGLPKTLRYRFEVQDADATLLFGAKGVGPRSPRFLLEAAHAGRFKTPEWVRDAVFYQIFPDRFRNGDSANDARGIAKLKRRPKGRKWTIDDAFLEAWDGKPSHNNFFGGDLAGITEKLDYIAALGVDSIYLNPIFKAASNHRYDAADFERVDPRLGSEEDFRKLCAAAKSRGIRILLDAVFNHTGDQHYAFLDLKKHGRKSRYKDWYFVDSFPVRSRPKPSYRCWWNFAQLPQLNTGNPKVVEHLLGVARKWLDAGAAGWRLDVPNEVDTINPRFWKQFRDTLRKDHPEAYILGEIWTAPKPWLNEDKFDATMNYPLRSAIIDFMLDQSINAGSFAERIAGLYAGLPEAAARVQFNLLGSHDTARIDRIAKGRKRRLRAAFGFLFGYLGAPVIYYGDEVGVTGGKDPDCRRSFPWDESKQDVKMLAWMRTLALTRRGEPALRRGTVETLLAKGRSLVIRRRPEAGDAGRSVLVAINASEKSATLSIRDGLTENGAPKDLLGQCSGLRREAKKLTFTLPPQGVAYIVAEH